jgi:acetyl esterase/lipase
VYFAGGGWQVPPGSEHWAFVAEMTNKVTGLTATLVSYPLAPESPASVAMPLLRNMYTTLMEESLVQGETVIFAGDSSGVNIAISLVTWALSEGETAPAAILAISPSTDLRHLDPGLKEFEKSDPVLTVPLIRSTAQAWSTPGGNTEDGNVVTWSAYDPRVSPVLADLKRLAKRGAKMHCVTGTHDVLSVETNVFRDHCNDAGVEGNWLEWEGKMHCFPLALIYKLRESKEGNDWIIDVLNKV